MAVRGKRNNRFAVTYIAHSAFTEGAERAMLNAIDGLLARDVYVHVVLPFAGPLEKYLQERKVDYSFVENSFCTVSEGVSSEDTKNLISENSLKLKVLLQELNPDVVVSISSVIQEGALAAKLLGIPHVWSISEYGRKEHGIEYLMPDKDRYRFMSKHSDKIFFVSEALRDYYGKNIDQKKAFVFPPISSGEILAKQAKRGKETFFSDKKSLKIALVGNIHEGKGQKDAVLAVSELVKRGRSDQELVIVGPVGDKHYLHEIKNLIKTNKLEKYITILPPVDSVVDLFTASDIVLMCSTYEAFGRVTAEAMLLGKPVIGANSGGTPELVQNYKTGFLYEPGNALELAERIDHFITKHEDISKFGERGYAYIMKKLDDKTNADRYYGELHSLMGKKNRPENQKSRVLRRLENVPVRELPVKIIRSVYWRIRNPIERILNIFVINPIRKVIWNTNENTGLRYWRWRRLYEGTAINGKISQDIKISIIVPVYNVEPRYLDMCIQSVVNQSYGNWELCLHDDCSTNEETKKCLEKWSTKDVRIKVSFGKKNQHISGASNDAIKLATGDYIGLLDNDDEISPNALYEVVRILQANPGVKYIYSDEDKINDRGDRFAPFFKPDWNPDLLLSMMYTSHFSVYSRAALRKAGGFRIGYEGSQDYDLALRVTEVLKPSEIYHIPKVLYHWRTLPGSTALAQSEKDYTSVAAIKSLTDYMKRNNIAGSADFGIAPGSYRVKRDIAVGQMVTIIIPFKDKVELLKVCLKSIFTKTKYDNFEILLVNNNSVEQETADYLKEIGKNGKVRVVDYPKKFNYAAINNFAAAKARGSHLLFLNNDIEVISPEWLSAMLEQSQRREVAAVGAKLLYPDNRIQHAGVIMGMGVAGHAHKFVPDKEYGFFSQAVVIRDYAAVTAACLMMKKKIFDKLGGFNEKDLPVAYNDVDLCLRALGSGYLNVYTPYAKLYHYESASRGYEHPDELIDKDPVTYKRVTSELNYMYKTWPRIIENDPYFSPNLSRNREDFQIRTER